MRRAALVVSISLMVMVYAPLARAGTAIKAVPECENSYLFYGPAIAKPDYRTALLCLINGARKAQGLPGLKRSAPLEAVGQAQAQKFAQTGSGSHGKSLTDITKRFAQHGYRAAAYNEAFAVGDAGTSPYAFLYDMLRRSGVPCTEIFDPRFRDVGIGVSAPSGGYVTTLALEFGRRVGTSQPSSRTKAAATCGHKVPAPKLTGYAIDITGPPTAGATTLTAQLKCVAHATCVARAAATLPDAHATSADQALTIAAGKTETVTFTFDAAAMAAERAATEPRVSIVVTATQPAPYSDTLTGPLPAASAGAATAPARR
ncbi:MAG TPA: CAP domain-containing protein [Baekduia sp.]|nr:CAP domain-containing protein [Baekduia sp.]